MHQYDWHVPINSLWPIVITIVVAIIIYLLMYKGKSKKK